MWDLKACRSCLSTNSKLEKFNDDSKRIYAIITGLRIANGDGYPNYLCVECSTQLKKIHLFRRRSRRAFFNLHAIMIAKKQITINEITNIDRKKNQLVSRYDYWKPHNVGLYSNTTSNISHDTKDKNEKSNCDMKINYNVQNKGNNFNVEIKINESIIKNSEIQNIYSKAELFKYTPKINNDYTCIFTDIKSSYNERERLEEKNIQTEEINEDIKEVFFEGNSMKNYDGIDERNIYSDGVTQDLKNDIKSSDKERERREEESLSTEEAKKDIKEVFDEGNSIKYDDDIGTINIYSDDVIKDLKSDHKINDNRKQMDMNADYIITDFKNDQKNNDSMQQKGMVKENANVTEKSLALNNKESLIQSKAETGKKPEGLAKLKMILRKDIKSTIHSLVVPIEKYKDYSILDNKQAPTTLNLRTSSVKRKLSNDVCVVTNNSKINKIQDDRYFIIKPRIQKLRTDINVIKDGMPFGESKEIVGAKQECQQDNKLKLLSNTYINENKLNIEHSEKTIGDKQDCQPIKKFKLLTDIKVKEIIMTVEESKIMVNEGQDCQQTKKSKLATDANIKETSMNDDNMDTKRNQETVVEVREAGTTLEKSKEIVGTKRDNKLGTNAIVEETSTNLQKSEERTDDKKDRLEVKKLKLETAVEINREMGTALEKSIEIIDDMQNSRRVKRFKLGTDAIIKETKTNVQESEVRIDYKQDGQEIMKWKLETAMEVSKPGTTLEKCRKVVYDEHDCQHVKRLKLETDVEVKEIETTLEKSKEIVDDKQDCQQVKRLKSGAFVKVRENNITLEESEHIVGEEQDCQQAKKLKLGTDANVKDTAIRSEENKEILREKQDCKLRFAVDADVKETGMNIRENKEMISKKQDDANGKKAEINLGESKEMIIEKQDYTNDKEAKINLKEIISDMQDVGNVKEAGINLGKSKEMLSKKQNNAKGKENGMNIGESKEMISEKHDDTNGIEIGDLYLGENKEMVSAKQDDANGIEKGMYPRGNKEMISEKQNDANGKKVGDMYLEENKEMISEKQYYANGKETRMNPGEIKEMISQKQDDANATEMGGMYFEENKEIISAKQDDANGIEARMYLGEHKDMISEKQNDTNGKETGDMYLEENKEMISEKQDDEKGIEAGMNLEDRKVIISEKKNDVSDIEVGDMYFEENKEMIIEKQDDEKGIEAGMNLEDRKVIISEKKNDVSDIEVGDMYFEENKEMIIEKQDDENGIEAGYLEDREVIISEKKNDVSDIEVRGIYFEENKEIISEKQDDAYGIEAEMNFEDSKDIISEKKNDSNDIEMGGMYLENNKEITSEELDHANDKIAGMNLEDNKEISREKLHCHRNVVNHSVTSQPCNKFYELDIYKCNFCQVRLQSANNYVNHILYNHTGKPYCCALCSSRYRHRFECKDHILKMHAPESPYRCRYCGKRFAHHDFLKVHSMLTHGIDLEEEQVFKTDHIDGKLYVYPHMKIDMRWISEDILEKIDLEVCDYLDENFRPVDDYRNYVIFENKELLLLKKVKPQKAEEKLKNEIMSKETIIENDVRLLINEESQNDFNYFEITDEKDVENVFGKENYDVTERNKDKMEIVSDKTIMTNENRIFINGDSNNKLDRVAKTNEELENMFIEHFRGKEQIETDNYEELELHEYPEIVIKGTILEKYERMSIYNDNESNLDQVAELYNVNKQHMTQEYIKEDDNENMKDNNKGTEVTDNIMGVADENTVIKVKSNNDLDFGKKNYDNTEVNLVLEFLETATKNENEHDKEIEQRVMEMANEEATIKSGDQHLINLDRLNHIVEMNVRNGEKTREGPSLLEHYPTENKKVNYKEANKSNYKIEIVSEETFIQNNDQVTTIEKHNNLDHDQIIYATNENIFKDHLNDIKNNKEIKSNRSKLMVVSDSKETIGEKDDRILINDQSKQNCRLDAYDTRKIIEGGNLKANNLHKKNNEATEINKNERKSEYKETSENDMLIMNTRRKNKVDHVKDILEETEANVLEEQFKADGHKQSGNIKDNNKESKRKRIGEEANFRYNKRALLKGYSKSNLHHIEKAKMKSGNTSKEHFEAYNGHDKNDQETKRNTRESVIKETITNNDRIKYSKTSSDKIEETVKKDEEIIFDEHLVTEKKRDEGEYNDETVRIKTKMEIASNETIMKNFDQLLINIESKYDHGTEIDEITEKNFLKEPIDMDDNDMKIEGEEAIIINNLQRLIIGKNKNLNHVKVMERKDEEDIFKECLEAEYGINHVAYDAITVDNSNEEENSNDENDYSRETDIIVEETIQDDHNEESDEKVDENSKEDDDSENDTDKENTVIHNDYENDFNEDTNENRGENMFEENNESENDYDELTDEIVEETPCEEDVIDFDREIDENIITNAFQKANEENKDTVDAILQEGFSDEVIFVKVNGVNYEVIERDGEQCVTINEVLYRIEHTE